MVLCSVVEAALSTPAPQVSREKELMAVIADLAEAVKDPTGEHWAALDLHAAIIAQAQKGGSGD
jgi:hypothetical protein